MEHQRPRITAAVLVEKDGKFLLAERNKQNYNGYWVIPGGGVQFGETLKDAAVRELKEETNIDADIIKQICYKEIINVPGNYHSIVFYYLAKPKNNNIKAKGDVSQAKFFSIEEIKKLKIAESVELVLKEAGFWK
ncbi:ADP-ribose pyrophosphatase [uncultured archaeon]|nr:ADP-ribose pyrophosphatase [uncultured archaeon]